MLCDGHDRVLFCLFLSCIHSFFVSFLTDMQMNPTEWMENLDRPWSDGIRGKPKGSMRWKERGSNWRRAILYVSIHPKGKTRGSK